MKRRLSMSGYCDHCGGVLDAAALVDGREGRYCSAICWYDEELLGVSVDELAPSETLQVVEP